MKRTRGYATGAVVLALVLGGCSADPEPEVPAGTASPLTPSPTPEAPQPLAHVRDASLAWDEIQELALAASHEADEYWFDEPIPLVAPAWVVEAVGITDNFYQWGVHEGKDVIQVDGNPFASILLERDGDQWSVITMPSATTVPQDVPVHVRNAWESMEHEGLALDHTTVYYTLTMPNEPLRFDVVAIPGEWSVASIIGWSEYGDGERRPLLDSEIGMKATVHTEWSTELAGVVLPGAVETGSRWITVQSPFGWDNNATAADDITLPAGLRYFPFGAVDNCRWGGDSATVVRGVGSDAWVPISHAHNGKGLYAAAIDNPLITTVSRSQEDNPEHWDWTPWVTPTDVDGIATADGQPALIAIQSSVAGEWYVWQQAGYFAYGGC